MTAAQITVRLARLACDLDELVSQLEELGPLGGEAYYADLASAHLTHGTARLGLLISETFGGAA